MVAAQQHLSFSDSSRLFEGPHTIKSTTVGLAVAAVAKAEAATVAESTKCVTEKCFTFPADAVEPSDIVNVDASVYGDRSGNKSRKFDA